MELKAFAPGIYPRSEALVQATRDLERGRTSPQAVAEQMASDFRELVSVQRAAGLSFLSDGLLAGQDIFRPLPEAAEGLDARPLTRFLDTNTFYRAVLADGRPRLSSPLPAPDLPAGDWVGTPPSPLAFARAANDAVSAHVLAAEVLAPQIQAWTEAGGGLVVLSEPFAAREGGVGERLSGLGERRGGAWPALLPPWAQRRAGPPAAPQLPFAAAPAVLPALAEAPIAAAASAK